MWRCRTIAFTVDPGEVVLFSCIINMRGKLVFKLPPGYYGNAFMYPTSISKAEMLCKNPLEYAMLFQKPNVQGLERLTSDGGRQFMVGLVGQYQLKASASGLGTKKEKEMLYLYAYLRESWKDLNVR